MKAKQAKVLLDKAVLTLGDRLADLVFEAQLLVHVYNTARSGEHITYDEPRRVYTHHSIGRWWNSVSAWDITKPNWTTFAAGARHGDKETIRQRFHHTLNSQFRWLLVTGYEAYERFLNDLYAILGHCDMDLWRCGDFGHHHHINTVRRMTLEDFRSRVRESSDIYPEKIRNLIGCLFPAVQKAENKNSIRFATEEMSFRDYIDFIAVLRHIIVHEQAVIIADDFFQRLNKKWKRPLGISGKLRALIMHGQFRDSGSLVEIWLVSQSDLALRDCTGLEAPLRTLIERISTHAHLLYKSCIEHFGHKAYWER